MFNVESEMFLCEESQLLVLILRRFYHKDICVPPMTSWYEMYFTNVFYEKLNLSCCFRTAGCRSAISWCPSTKSL